MDKAGIDPNIKYLKKQTAILSFPNKLLSDKNRIVKGLTAAGNLSRNSIIIKSNDGNDIKILNKGIIEEKKVKEKKVKEPKEKKVKEPKEPKVKKVKEPKEPKEPPKENDENEYISKIPDNLKTYTERYKDGDIKIRQIKDIKKKDLPYIKPEGYIDFNEINELYNKYDIKDWTEIKNIRRSYLGTNFTTTIPVSLLTYYFNKMYKFITDDDIKTLETVKNKSVILVPIIIEHFISNIEIVNTYYSTFNYNCLVIPTKPKAKRIWLADIASFELQDIIGRGIIMIELNTNKIVTEDPSNFYLKQALIKDAKKRPEVYKDIAKLIKDSKIFK